MRLYLYVIEHDKGFAPNPFFGACTLAACKPQIRESAVVGEITADFGSKPSGPRGALQSARNIDPFERLFEHGASRRRRADSRAGGGACGYGGLTIGAVEADFASSGQERSAGVVRRRRRTWTAPMTSTSPDEAQHSYFYLRVDGMVRTRTCCGTGGRKHPSSIGGGNIALHPASSGGRQSRTLGCSRGPFLQSDEYHPRRMDHDDARRRHGARRTDDSRSRRNLPVARNLRQIRPPDIHRVRGDAHHSSRRAAHAHCHHAGGPVEDLQGKLYAHGASTCLVVRG